ncbi:ABC transporter permease [Caldibacillus lycopersici]|uniref:ABC transporter permease n=1 Tax=Perspicuibacillus lycopersici TaxID=1325689 RepID=A0AAE3IUY9_9BACI|nr:ABC transporter permease [Perspicuibacillus lycopersici]MCU9614932.1 ABC transporter permease [Perspicuibacillus lycopersici]
MITITLFEMKKIIKSIFFFVMLAFLCVFLIGYYVFVHHQTVPVEKLIVETESMIHMQEQQIQELKRTINNSEDGGNSQLQLDLTVSEQLLSKNQILLKAYQEEDWQAVLQQEIESNEPEVERMKAGNEYYTSTFPTLFTLESRLEYNKWLLSHNITPVLPIDFYSWYTVYDLDFGDPIAEEYIKKQSEKYSSTGVYFLHHTLNLLFTIFGALIFLFLFGDILTKEGLGKNGPIHFLHTQPLSRLKIFIGKLLAVLFLSLFVIVFISGFCLLIGSLFDGFGYFYYPVLIYGEDFSFTFQKMSTVIFQSGVLFIFVLLFSYALLFLFSILTKRTLTAVGLTIVVLYIGIQWGKDTILSSFSPYIPFHYFSITDIVTNTFAASVKNFAFSMSTGCIVLSISTIALLFLSYFLFHLQNKLLH